MGFPQAIERKEILMMHLSRFDNRYKNGDVLTDKEWRIVLNKTVNCTGAELAQMVQKAARSKFHQGKKMEIGLHELLEQREMMVPLYVRDTDRILALSEATKVSPIVQNILLSLLRVRIHRFLLPLLLAFGEKFLLEILIDFKLSVLRLL